MVDQRAGDGAIQFGEIGSVGVLNINSPPTASGIPFQAPPLPSHFVDRPETSQDLKQRLCVDSNHRSGTLVISAIQGLGGIGKTILAQALAHDSDVQKRFCDGILWATLGQQPDVLSLLQGWIVALKDYDYKPTTVKAASNHLNSLLYDKAVLLVIDDGWELEDIEPFRVGSGKCQVIITTRRADVAEETNAQIYSLDLMSEEQSLMLLSNRLGRELEDKERESAKQLAKAVGYLPIALDLAAARVARGKSWSELHSALTAEIARLEVLEGVRRRRKNETRLEACFNLSLNFLREDFPESWNSFVWLGVLPEDISIAAPMVATLWQVDVTEAADRLELFWNDALLLPGVPVRIGAEEWQTYRIHDLLHDLAINWLTNQDSPGLGLTIPQAHGVLLERYQKQLSDGKWHKLADDGYIHEHLTWHMEKAECVDSIHQLLREETESGKNGWYEACDRLGKTAIFVGDVARAWKHAELEFDANPTKAIGLQCRYALITSSLNTIAGNIPPELIAALVEKKVWTPAQGLAYSRQVQSPVQRVEALSQLASYFPEIGSEVLDAALNIAYEFDRQRALTALAPHLPENLIPKALDAALNIANGTWRAWALTALAPHLPENLISKALDAALNIDSFFSHDDAFIALAPHLPENLISKALDAALNIDYDFNRQRALTALVPHLPEIWFGAFAAALNIADKDERFNAITALAPHLPENLVPEALDAARNIADESHRARVLTALAPYLPENLVLEALDATLNIDEFYRVEILTKLAPHLPENLIPEFLQIVRSIDYDYYRAQGLTSLAQHLPEIWSEVLETTRHISFFIHARADVLSYLATHLPDNLIPEVLEIAENIGDDYYRADVLSSLAQHLPEIWSEVLEIARNIDNNYSRARVLSSLAPHLPENLVPEVLEIARNMGSDGYCSDVLVNLAPHLPENLVPEVLQIARNIDDDYHRASVLSSFAPHLLENLVPEVLQIARNIDNNYSRASVLSSLAQHLPEIWSEVLETTQHIYDETEKLLVLNSLAPHLPENLVPEFLEIAQSLYPESCQAEALSSLAPHLPENLVPEFLEIAWNMDDESNRARVLSGLASNVHKMFDSFPYDFWCELIHSLASLKRRDLLSEISKNSQIVKELGGSLTFREIADAIIHVGRWFS